LVPKVLLKVFDTVDRHFFPFFKIKKTLKKILKNVKKRKKRDKNFKKTFFTSMVF